MKAFEVWAQADVVTVRLTLAPKGQAGNVEWTILQAIRAGATTPDDLADVFGLAPRLVVEVLADLWRAGRISVQLGTEKETLALTEAGRAELDAAGSRQELASSSSNTATEELLIERLTGRVLPLRSSQGRPQDREAVVPVLPDDRSLATVTSAELAEALYKVLEQTGGARAYRSGDLRVEEAHLQPEFLRVTARRRYVPIRVNANLSAVGELSVGVVDERLSVRDRAAATSRLQSIVDANPRSEFATRVRAQAERVPLEVRGIDQVLDEFARMVQNMGTCAPHQRQSAHDKAADLTAQVTSFAQWAASSEMDLSLVQSSAEHEQALAELIRSAHRQVVLAVPWVRASGLERLRNPILDALERGVQIVLLWGIAGGAQELGRPESAWLDSMAAHAIRTAHAGRLLYSRHRAARSHAKVAVADDRRMLVTSKNFLSDSDLTELGALLTASGDEASPAIESALQYFYDRAPDPQIAASLNRVRGAFGERTEPELVPPPMPRWRAELGEDLASEAQVKVWAAGWAEVFARARSSLTRPRPTVDLVVDLQHRGLLRGALEESTHRVLVTSDRVSDSALTGDVVELAQRKARQGLPVVVRYQQVTGEGRDRLDELRGGDGPRSTPPDVQANPQMHAKVVLHDDTVVLGSINPLSVDSNIRNRRSTGELSVRIDSAPFADLVWQVLTGAPAPEAVRAEAEPLPEAAGPSAAQEMLDAVAMRSIEALQQLITQHGLTLLQEAHERFGLPEENLRSLAAAALASDLERGHDPSRSGALLLRCLLETGNWGIFHLIRQHLPDPDLRPRAELTSALSDGGPDGQALLAGLTTSGSLAAEEVEALRLTDLVGVLLGDVATESADLGAAEGQWEIHHAAAAALDRLGTAYWQRYGPLPHTPPTMMAMPSGPDRSVLWRDARAAVDALQRYPSKSATGDALQRHLYAPDGEMTHLAVALEGEDIEAVEQWQARFTADGKDENWLDDSVRQAGLSKIDGSRRKSFLHRLRRIREAVTALVAQHGQQLADPGEVWSEEQLATLRELMRVADVALAQMREEPTPERSIAASSVSRLIAWGRGEKQPEPLRDWDSWPFVTTRLYLKDQPEPTEAGLLKTVCEDLVSRRNASEAVHGLAAEGAFEWAELAAEQAEELGAIDPVQRQDLMNDVTMRKAEAQSSINEAVQGLRLQCERAGVTPASAGVEAIEVHGDSADAQRELRAMESRVAAAAESQRDRLRGLLAQRRPALDPGWAAYIESLVEGGELQIAELDLKHTDGAPQLPRPPRFSGWTWRRASPGQMAAWFSTASGSAPPGLRERFTPAPGDAAGWAVIEALQVLGQDGPEAARHWAAALQGLVDDFEGGPRPRPHQVEGGIVTEFLMPSNNHLPRLKWTGEEAVRFSLGETHLPDTLLRLSLDDSLDTQTAPTLYISDVLSLLTRADGTAPPKASERAFQFLSIVCSRLPLADVIEPQHMPAGFTGPSRRRLAWLLSILGVGADSVDLDRLRARAGGHAGVLWTLVEAARTTDPIDGVRTMGGAGDDLDEVLVSGIERDLDRDDDLLLLGLGLSSEFLQIGCTREELAEALVDLWTDSGGLVVSERMRVSESVARLMEAGYVAEDHGKLFSCGCAASRALARRADPAWLASLVDRVDAVERVEGRAFEMLLEMIRHQQRAAGAIGNDVSDRAEARRRAQGHLSDHSAFELRDLCRDVVDRLREQHRADILLDLGESEVWVASCGPRIWVDCMIQELVTNAVAATSDLAPGEGTVWLRIVPHREDGRVSLVVGNNGRPMPEEVIAAFRAGRRARDVTRPGRGTGLHTYRVFGERHGVKITLGESENETEVTCTLPSV